MNKKQRKKHNNRIINKMKRGEPLNTVAPSSTWFPPRPIVKKDRDAIKKLYNVDLPDGKLKIVQESDDNTTGQE